MSVSKEPYRPSNGMEGLRFYNAYCSRCVHEQAFINSLEENGCDILSDTQLFDLDDPHYPTEWTYVAGQGPCCSSFEQSPDKPMPRCRLTMDLFGAPDDLRAALEKA